jgi:hypothetical protein
MALITCPECSSEVSDKAMACTKCGVQLRKSTRTIFGKIVKFMFIAFNALMAFWIFGATQVVSKAMTETSGAEQAGAAIGAGIGTFMIIFIWVSGVLILGIFVLFTRPK